MIKVVSRRTIKPENIDTVIKMYDEMIDETRKENGCISYEFFRDVNDPNTVIMIEEWENEDCFNAHSETSHFKKIIPQIIELQESNTLHKLRRLR